MIWTLPDSRHLLFLHLPKCGGQAVTHALRRLPWPPHEKTSNWPSAVHRLRHHYSGDFALSFAFVRHPLTWYESYYRYRSASGWERIEGGGLPWLLDGCRAETFGEFIDNALSHEPRAFTRLVEWHVGPPGGETVDYVGRLETLAEDLTEIGQRAGFVPDLRAAPVNASDRRILCLWRPGQREAILAGERPVVERWYRGHHV